MEFYIDAPSPMVSPLTLDELGENMQRARALVAVLRTAPIDKTILISARSALLGAMEAYALELAERQLPVPPRLRDDLRLQRQVRGEEARRR